MRISARWRPRLRQIVQHKSKYVWKAGGPGRMLVFGLGNLPYPKTRHRCGFICLICWISTGTHKLIPNSVAQLVIDGLAARFDLKLKYESRALAYHAETRTSVPTKPGNLNLKLTLAKTSVLCFSSSGDPHSSSALDLLMNESGRAVKKTYEEKLHNTQTFHPRNRRTIILHDSIDHKPCTASPRFGGSARGHNGVRSIMSTLGTPDFYRIRLGIGYPPHGTPLEQYVLGKLSREEVDYWSPGGEGVEKVWEAIVRIIQDEYVLSCPPSLDSIPRPYTYGNGARTERGREELKLDPKGDMPAVALLPGPFGWKSTKQIWNEYVMKVREAMAAAQARPSRAVHMPPAPPKMVLTEKEIARGREKGKDVVQMLLERLRGKTDKE